jgi:hypothetical protein
VQPQLGTPAGASAARGKQAEDLVAELDEERFPEHDIVLGRLFSDFCRFAANIDDDKIS